MYSSTLGAQQATALFTTVPIAIDGKGESTWDRVPASSPFWQYFPSDSIQAPHQTQVKFMFDQQYLYVLIEAETEDANFITPSLRRDFSFRNSDSVTLILDTFNDNTNAFVFGTNPEGVQREALIANGGNSMPRDFNSTWDTTWEVAVTKKENGYVSEMKIPFSNLRYDENSRVWQVNIYRSEIAENQSSTWANIPRNQSIAGLAYMIPLTFDRALPKVKKPIAIIPYTSGIATRNFNDNRNTSSLSMGSDAKLSVGQGMILDLTYNPDFSQVEVDDQIINLSRFEIRLPEKRQFFIQNKDLFESFGDRWETQPFFSRRIGVARDQEGNTIENRIIAGARLSGKITPDLRLGFLNMQTQADPENGIAGNNNTVFALQQKMFSRSFLGFMFVNRQQTGDPDFSTEQTEYNRVVGIEYTLASKDNKWTGKTFIHQSFQPSRTRDNYSAGFRLNYNTRKNYIRYGGNRIGEGYASDLGFLRRTDIQKHFFSFTHRLWIDSKTLRSIELQQNIFYFDKPKSNNLVTDRNLSYEAQLNFTNQARLKIEYGTRYTYLTNAFSPMRGEEDIPLPENTGYRYNDLEIGFNSNYSKKLNVQLNANIGEFYNGKKLSLRTEVNLRLQPRFNGSLKVNYDRIELPAPYASGELWLVGPKLDYTFSKRIFWNTFIQYSSQAENLGINSRLQWRFAPLSDFYIVYNDNYFASSTFVPTVRSITFKLTYWLNI